MKPVAKCFISVILAIVMLSSAAMAFAQGGTPGPGGPGGGQGGPGGGQGGPGGGPGGHGGQVTAIDDATIVVKNQQGSTENIVTTDDTKFTVNNATGSLSDISVGMYVFAKGEMGSSSTFTATEVMASDKAPQPPAGGQVTSIDDATIVVKNQQGNSQNIVTTDDTTFKVNNATGSLSDITVGMYVFAKGEMGSSGTFTATEVMASNNAPQPPDKNGQGQGSTNSQ
jgi:cytochrome c-type biogenesis protein CcmE